MELTVALYRNFDFPKDKLIFDVGHQCYTHKILSGRSLDHLRQRSGVSGFERRSESVYDCYEAGHSGTSLSAAEGFVIARDLKQEKYDVVVVIGDSSMVNGLSFEALNNIGSRKDKVIIILNDNDMSISRPVGGLGNFFRKISVDRLYNRAKKAYQHAFALRLREASNGKDTMTGHWEMMGVLTTKPFQTFTDTGFPESLITLLEKETGHKIIGNYASSGTEILKVLGEEQMKENSLIVYTSADSVLQIAAHEGVTGKEELYRCCEIARKTCMKQASDIGFFGESEFVLLSDRVSEMSDGERVRETFSRNEGSDFLHDDGFGLVFSEAIFGFQIDFAVGFVG